MIKMKLVKRLGLFWLLYGGCLSLAGIALIIVIALVLLFNVGCATAPKPVTIAKCGTMPPKPALAIETLPASAPFNDTKTAYELSLAQCIADDAKVRAQLAACTEPVKPAPSPVLK